MTGKISELSRDRGFGFIVDNAGRKRFFHRSAVLNSGFDNLRQGLQVQFEPRDDVKGLRAINVRPAMVGRARPGAVGSLGTAAISGWTPIRRVGARRPDCWVPPPVVPVWRSSLSPFRGEPPSASPPRRRRG